MCTIDDLSYCLVMSSFSVEKSGNTRMNFITEFADVFVITNDCLLLLRNVCCTEIVLYLLLFSVPT